MTDEHKAAEDNYWLSRLEAKAAYKKWASSKDENGEYARLHQEYVSAWQRHQEAGMALFLIECDEE